MKIQSRMRLLDALAILTLWSFAVSAEITAQTTILDQAVIERARIYEPAIKDAATKHGVDARMLWTIAYLETRFNPALVSRKGARGLMQFMPTTAERFALANPHDPHAAIGAAARYVRFLGGRFNKRADLILAAYNSGEVTVEAYLTGRSIKVGKQIINSKGVVTGGIPPYRETQEYVNVGLKLISIIQQKGSFRSTEDLPSSEEIGSQGGLVRKSIRSRSESPSVESSNVPGRRSIYFVRAVDEE